MHTLAKFALALLLVSFSLRPVSAAPTGDANGDGAITVADGVQVLRAAHGLASRCDENCDLDGSGAPTVTDGTLALRRAAGLLASPSQLRVPSRGVTTPSDVHFIFDATTGLQGFQIEVAYPLAKGGFEGSADAVNCTSNGGGVFLANDRDDGTMVLIEAAALDLTFPIIITCRFEQTGSGILQPGDLSITVVEVVHQGAAGDPTTLLVDVAVGDLPVCSTGHIRLTTRPGGLLDAGWTGLAHDGPLPTDASVSFPLDCAPGSSVCAIDGRHVVDTPAGAPLALSAGGVSTCVLNSFREPVTGTYDCAGGCTEATVKLLSTVFLVQDAEHPCPPCVGDLVPNDGTRDGTCLGGRSPGAACDAAGRNARFDAVGPDFGTTSHDCLPTGSSVGEVATDLAPLTTGTTSLAATVNCLSNDFPPGSCHCPNQMQPNSCLDGVCAASGLCEEGPIDGICSGHPFRQCRSGTTTEDCGDVFPGAGSCVDQPRACFSDTIARSGSCGTQDGVLTGVFCVGNTRAAAINTVQGLPGPAALSLPIRVEAAPRPMATFVSSPTPGVTPSPTAPGCGPQAQSGCRRIGSPHESVLAFHDRPTQADELAWRWLGGEATEPVLFGDPINLTTYALCAYASASEGEALVFDARAQPEACRGSKSCWLATPGGGFVYRNAAGNADGLTRLELTPGDDGAARIVVKGRGSRLTLPPMPLPLPLTVQLQASNGSCWEATYEPEDVRRNEPTHFRALSH